jgi:Site-specific recombinase XerD
MATVVKDPRNRSPFWYACFTTADGRRLKKSTKETSHAKALQMALGWEKAAKEAREKRLNEARTREILSEILGSVNGGEGLRVFTVEDWFDHFVKQKQKSQADKTALRHEQMMTEFVAFLGHRASLNIATVTSKDIAGFRNHRESLGLAPSTLNGDVTILSAAFNAALRQGHIRVNPCAEIEDIKDKVTARKETFTAEQVAALVRSADNDDWRGLIFVGFYCGQRLGDCANLQWKQINLAAEIKTVRFQQGKTGEDVVIVVHPVLEKFLTGLRKQRKVVPLTAQSDEAYVFPSLAQRNISPLSKHFRLKIMERAGIKQRVIRKRDESGSGRSVNALTFHSLRHTFNSILANAGIAEETRMALTGHTTREMNQRYTHRELEVFRAAIGMLPGVAED